MRYLIALIFTSALGYSQSTSVFIVVDQFGYRPNAEKIAVIRDPQTGFDAAQSFAPGNTYSLINVQSGQTVFSAAPKIWNGGAEDASSGDKAWWFDFSSVTTIGKYYVLDVTNNVRSYEFEIKNNVYNVVLKEACRSFYYQRAGFAKQSPYAETGWVDGASHIGNLQDKNCRKYNTPNDASTEKDLSGGWYDAGDYNKYTSWTSNYIYEMLLAYQENPSIWSDDFNIPESGNGIPDIIDEAKWGMDHLLRLQNSDGSLISVVSLASASPPSSATGQSLYGGVNSSSTSSSASTFAFGAKIFAALGMTEYANQLGAAAVKAYDWAAANPAVIWKNNDAASGTSGIAAGQQETDDYGRKMYQLRAAMRLFELKGDAKYKQYFDAIYTETHLIQWNFAYPFETDEQEVLLHYTLLNNATPSVVSNIKSIYSTAIEGASAFKAFDTELDPYTSYMKDYTWGSNGTKSNQGNMFYDVVLHAINSGRNNDAIKFAERHIHYIHGLNPLNKVYLSNMGKVGGDNSVKQFYHSWFKDGSALWDEVGVSTYGPPPGFLVGGANPSYNWDACCPTGCGSAENNALCTSVSLAPPKGQPKQKSYLDFNTNWPLNSWEITENSGGQQIAYIRLLSKFVDSSGTITDVSTAPQAVHSLQVFPNPSKGLVSVIVQEKVQRIILVNSIGQELLEWQITQEKGQEIKLNCATNKGVFVLKVALENGEVLSKKLVLE